MNQQNREPKYLKECELFSESRKLIKLITSKNKHKTIDLTQPYPRHFSSPIIEIKQNAKPKKLKIININICEGHFPARNIRGSSHHIQPYNFLPVIQHKISRLQGTHFDPRRPFREKRGLVVNIEGVKKQPQLLQKRKKGFLESRIKKRLKKAVTERNNTIEVDRVHASRQNTKSISQKRKNPNTKTIFIQTKQGWANRQEQSNWHMTIEQVNDIGGFNQRAYQ